jgi:glutathione S-transferase
MKIYGSPFSPFTQRVMIAGRLKGHELTLAPPPGGSIESAEFAEVAAMRRVPVLADEDGWHLCESAAIVAYLEETLSGRSLYPDNQRARARTRQIEGIVDTEVGAGLRHFALQSMFTVYSNPSQLDYGRAQLLQGLAALEHIGIGASSSWAVGSEPGAADAALVPQLAFAAMMTEHFDGGPLISTNPTVEAYWWRVREHPTMARTIDAMAGVVSVVMARRAELAVPAQA